jgi:four helix bundle protein
VVVGSWYVALSTWLSMNSYKDLDVWQKSIEIVLRVYELSKKLSEDEKFNLTSQMRRSAVSIPSNIAEGHGRKTDGEFKHFLRIAYGSSSELETQLYIVYRLEYITKMEYDTVSEDLIVIRKMLNKLMSSIE